MRSGLHAAAGHEGHDRAVASQQLWEPHAHLTDVEGRTQEPYGAAHAIILKRVWNGRTITERFGRRYHLLQESCIVGNRVGLLLIRVCSRIETARNCREFAR